MLGWVSGAWNAVKGAGALIWSFATDAFWHFIGGLIELPSFLGFMPSKKLRLRVVILLERDSATNALDLVAPRLAVDEAVEVATDVYWREAKIRIQGAGGFPVVQMSSEPAPDYVLFPPCGDKSDFVAAQFNRVGAWFRRHRATNFGRIVGYGTPVTVFIVDTVRGRGGCAVAGFFGGYAYVGKSWLVPGAVADGVTLAHEMGHILDLSLIEHHPSRANVMYSNSQTPARSELTAWQRYWIRGGPHVTYF